LSITTTSLHDVPWQDELVRAHTNETLDSVLHDLYPDGLVPIQKVEQLRAAIVHSADPILSFTEFQCCIALQSDLEMWTASLPLSSLVASALSLLAPPSGQTTDSDPLQSLAQCTPDSGQAVLRSTADELSRVVFTALDRLRKQLLLPRGLPPGPPEAVTDCKYVFDPDLAGPATDYHEDVIGRAG
jgi:hypothetical protein